MMAKCRHGAFRFDVHGFTADCQQDENGIREAAQLCEFCSFFLTGVCLINMFTLQYCCCCLYCLCIGQVYVFLISTDVYCVHT